jgi:hypothetical protein
MRDATPSMVPVIAGTACIGFLISLGPRGVEAFDKDEQTLGVFASVVEAAAAVQKSAGAK